MQAIPNMPFDKNTPRSRQRRHMLVAGLGGAGLAGLRGSRAQAATGAAPALLPLTAQTTEGPYYLDIQRERADITEGQGGVPLDVRFTVCDAQGKPLAGMRVDIWHCNTSGIYSGYAGQGDDHNVSAKGQTFLRGSQTTAADGVVTFHTIYPGWYEGRTTHIHMKAIHGTRAVLTSQFFLPDGLSEYLYTQLPAYRRRRTRDTLNSTDGIALKAGDTVVGAVRQLADRYVADLTWWWIRRPVLSSTDRLCRAMVPQVRHCAARRASRRLCRDGASNGCGCRATCHHELPPDARRQSGSGFQIAVGAGGPFQDQGIGIGRMGGRLRRPP